MHTVTIFRARYKAGYFLTSKMIVHDKFYEGINKRDAMTCVRELYLNLPQNLEEFGTFLLVAGINLGLVKYDARGTDCACL